MPRNVYLNGRIVPAESATLSVFDAGFLHGASTFTTMLAHNGKVFRLERHLERLMDTVALLSLRTNATASSLTAGVYELLTANGLGAGGPAAPGEIDGAGDDQSVNLADEDHEPRSTVTADAASSAGPPDARLRITLTPGSPQGGPPTVLITAEPVPPPPDYWYTKGLTVIVTSFKQAKADPTFGYKTGCYLPRVLARQEAAGKGADEALWYTWDGRLAEACFNNVFLVLQGKVFTPPRDTPVLPGIVRQAVLELCGELGIPCECEQPLSVREMLDAEEIFLTGSTSGLRPVVRVERHAVGNEQPGPVTRRLMDAYRRLLEAECPL